jgi:V8-like Glu-specific endopeptidase
MRSVEAATTALAAALTLSACTGPEPDADRPASTPTPPVRTIGILLADDDTRLCTAAVVGDSRLVTAAHCVVDDGAGMTFVPGYHDGERPYGTWDVTAVRVDPAWSQRRDPDADVAILTVADDGDRRIADVVGANALGRDSGDVDVVEVIGYPADAEQPRGCRAEVRPMSPTQLRLDCTDLPQGTSGGPWLTGYDPDTGTGTVIGVIGGYEEGGATADTSYSVRFGETVRRLYDEAG